MLAIPLEFRLALCMLAGALAGSLINFGIYQFAWNRRPISPWSPAPQELAPRTWVDRIPVIGWLRLRREAGFHGAGFWIRPLILELLTAAGFAALYVWEVEWLSLFPPGAVVLVPPAGRWLAPLTPAMAHWPLLGHYLLLVFLLMATFIDIDEKTIPDQVTFTGVLMGLILATAQPWTLLPGLTLQVGVAAPQFEFLHIASPSRWPALLDGGWPNYASLSIGLLCFWLWCFALLPRTWHGRYGVRLAFRYLFARILRDPFSRLIGGVWLLGSLAIATVWWCAEIRWTGLLSALVGMAAGMAIIWAVRLVGRAILKKEAMGFGDVTLMAMIGAFTGWQASLIIFFLAPMAGLLVGGLQFLLKRDNIIPYGPFLSLATLVTLVWWSPIWNHLFFAFTLGWLIPLAMVVCMLVMAVLLFGLQWIKRLLRY